MIRRLTVQALVLLAGVIALIGLGGMSSVLSGNRPAAAWERVASSTGDTVSALKNELKTTQAELERAHLILEYSGRYAIPADLSALIYDAAIAEGIPASIGFQMVKVESGFQNSAQSVASAIGLTQLRLPTARSYDATVNASDLMTPDVNLKLGFRYFKDLLKRFGNDVEVALEAYNKGPTYVTAMQDSGGNVKGRYSQVILKGSKKAGGS